MAFYTNQILLSGSRPIKTIREITDISALPVTPQLIALASVTWLFLILGIINLFSIIFSKKEIYPNNKTSPVIPQKTVLKILFMLIFYFLLVTFGISKIINTKLIVEPNTASAIANAILLIGSAGILLQFAPREITRINFTLNNFKLAFKTFTAILPACLLAKIININLIHFFNIPETVNPAIKILNTTTDIKTVILLFLLVSVLAPITEEIFFRGTLFSALRIKRNFMISAISTALLFSLMHEISADILPLFFIGMFLAWSYEHSKEISVPIMVHALFNGWISIMLLLIKASL